MENSKRIFLKIAGVSALGLGTGILTPNVLASSGEKKEPGFKKNSDVLTAKRWGMVIDTRKIESSDDLEPIINACNKIHNIPEIKNHKHEIKWIWEEEFKHAFPTKDNKYLNERIKDLPFLVLCNHCGNPSCVQACPTKATFQRDDGIVLMDFHRCIGCRFCMAACPYGSRSFNFIEPKEHIKSDSYNPEFPRRTKGVVEKCNFCAERLAVGKKPACVEASNGAIIFGDLEKPDSEIREVLNSNYTIRRKQGLGTEPSIFYII
jgi:molybdopterin-containing oxidoreductase family iron-sulfur binding subunit